MSFTKIKKIKQQSGFTIIELIIVIVIIAILATISSLSYEKILGNVRNSQRASNAKVLAEALEKYYDQNGEYPGCATMTNSDLSVVTSALKGLNAKVLTAPLADSGTNSLTCADISDNEDDVLLYSKDKRASCLTGNSCGSFSLEYHDELNSTSIIKIASRRNAITGGSYAISIGGGSTGIEQMTSLVALMDGNYISVGGTNTDSFTAGGLDVLIVKHNSAGDILWSKTWGGPGDESAISVISSSDGGFVVAGTTTTFDTIGGEDGFLLKYTSNGDLSWSRTFGSTSTDLVNYAAKTSDGGYIVVGDSTISNANDDAFIAKIDSGGTLLWCNTYGGEADDVANSVVETSDGKFVLVGKTYSLSDGVRHSFMALFDNSGGYLNNVVMSGDSRDSADGVAQLKDGSIIVAGRTQNYGSGYIDVSIVRYDSNGDIQSYNVWGGSGDDVVSRIISTLDGGYLIIGATTDSFSPNEESMYLKFSSSDVLEFSNTWSNGIDDVLYSAVQDTDHGYIMSGLTTPIDSMPIALMLKVSDAGIMNGCKPALCKSVTGTLMNIGSIVMASFTPTVVSAGMVLTDVTGTVNVVSPVITKIVYK